MAEEKKIASIVEFLRMIRAEKDVTVLFTKANGDRRLMKCTLDFSRIPKDKQPNEVDLPKMFEMIEKHKLIRVYDLEKHGWRSIPFNRVEWVEDKKGERFSIRKR